MCKYANMQMCKLARAIFRGFLTFGNPIFTFANLQIFELN